jgi:hypothetical protein
MNRKGIFSQRKKSQLVAFTGALVIAAFNADCALFAEVCALATAASSASTLE